MLLLIAEMDEGSDVKVTGDSLDAIPSSFINNTANVDETSSDNSRPEDVIVDPLCNPLTDTVANGDEKDESTQEWLTAIKRGTVEDGGDRDERDIDGDEEDNEDVGTSSFENLSPLSDDMQGSTKGFRKVLGEELQQSLLNHYERADLELSLPPPGRTGAMRNMPVVKAKGDLEVTIEDHEKRVISENEMYISYKVCVKTSRLDVFQQESYEVWRRYNDFDWLHRQLLKAHPILIVPPLPGKQVAKFLSHMTAEFIQDRKVSLCMFLTRLVEHPILTFDKHLKMFLTVSSEDLAAEQAATINPGFWSGLSSSVQKATTSLWLRNPDQEFAKQMKYVSSLSEKLVALEKTENKLQEERNALVAANRDFSPVVNTWADTDVIMATPLKQFASCNSDCCKAILQLNVDSLLSFQHKVHEYQQYCTTVQGALRNRDRMQLTSDSLLEEKAKKIKARDEAKAAAKESRLPKLEKDLEEVTVQSEKALDNLTKCNADLRADIKHWHEQKDAELCQTMTQTADNYINYHQKCFGKWEELLRTLKDFQVTSTIETIDAPSSYSDSSSDEH